MIGGNPVDVPTLFPSAEDWRHRRRSVSNLHTKLSWTSRAYRTTDSFQRH